MSFLPVGSSNRCIDVALCFVKHPQESSARYGTAIAAGTDRSQDFLSSIVFEACEREDSN